MKTKLLILFAVIAVILFLALTFYGINDKPVDTDQKALSADQIQQVKTNVSKLTGGADVNKITALDFPNTYLIDLKGANPIVVSADGKYILGTQLYKVGENNTLTNIVTPLLLAENARKLALVKDTDLIIYPSTTEKEKFAIYVFTDPTCPYCQAFHKSIPEINKLGITVKYVLFPRAEQVKSISEQVWCSPDRKIAFEMVSNGTAVNSAVCDYNPIQSFINLGHELAANGTPNIYSVSGEKVGGYMEPKQLLETLESMLITQ